MKTERFEFTLSKADKATALRAAKKSGVSLAVLTLRGLMAEAKTVLASK